MTPFTSLELIATRRCPQRVFFSKMYNTDLDMYLVCVMIDFRPFLVKGSFTLSPQVVEIAPTLLATLVLYCHIGFHVDFNTHNEIQNCHSVNQKWKLKQLSTYE